MFDFFNFLSRNAKIKSFKIKFYNRKGSENKMFKIKKIFQKQKKVEIVVKMRSCD